MNEKKFLQQVYTKLENQLEQEVKLADDSIEISEGDKVIFGSLSIVGVSILPYAEIEQYYLALCQLLGFRFSHMLKLSNIIL